MSDVTINKGTRIRAKWFIVSEPAPSLSGAQMKLGCTQVEVSGIVRHVRCDDLENPTVYRLFIDPDTEVPGVAMVQLKGCTCGRKHLRIIPEHVYWAKNP